MPDKKNWTGMITLLLRPILPEDTWAFLGDFACFLYDLDITGVLRTELLTQEDWGRAVEQISQAHRGLHRFSPSLRHVNDQSRETTVEILRKLYVNPETLHENAAAVFQEAFRQAVAIRNDRDFITPAPLADLMAHMLQPKVGDRILDPVCGSGGLLAACTACCSGSRFWGMDIHSSFAEITYFNLHFRGAMDLDISVGDFFEYADKIADTFDIVLANPPYNSNLQQTIRFLISILKVLKSGKRCGVLVPEGLLSNTAASTVVDFKRWLLQNHALEAVVSLPNKIYRPYTESKSSLLLLRKDRAMSSKPVFYAELPEFMGAEKDFSPSVYRDDMEHIAEVWNRYTENPMYRDPLFLTVTPEVLEWRKYDLSFNTHFTSAYPANRAPVKQWRMQLSQRQNTLDQLFRDYIEGKP